MTREALTTAQRKHLKALAHHLKPVVLIGAAGVTDAVMKEVDNALAAHELVKIKVPAEDRGLRRQACEEIAGRTSAGFVQLIGKTAILYRPHPDKPKIRLPGG